VLVVDDDDDWRSVIADVLSEEGFSVSTASNGRAACVSLRRARPEVVVTDVEMPLMTGRELLAWLRSTDRTLPVIVVTAKDDPAVDANSPNAFRVLRKPATAEAIVSAVKEALQRRPEPLLGKISRAAKALAYGARRRGETVLSRSAQLLRPAKAEERSPVSKPARRGRARLAMVAGVGMTALAVLAVAAIRGAVV